MNNHTIAAATLALGLALGPTTASCTLREGSTQLEDVAYLTFEGDSNGLLLQVDSAERIDMRESSREVRYEVATGTHRVRIWRDEELIVDRMVFVSQGQGFRITLP